MYLLRCPTSRFCALLALVAIGTGACSERFSQEETLFLFPYKTRVDARLLACGYHAEEKCSDALKRKIRREVGPVDWLEQQAIGERITLICDCVRQLNGRQFVWARNADDLVGWVDKKYLRLNKE